MYNYSFISVTALFCYMILFVAFMAAQKTKIIHSFLVVLAAFFTVDRRFPCHAYGAVAGSGILVPFFHSGPDYSAVYVF